MFSHLPTTLQMEQVFIVPETPFADEKAARAFFKPQLYLVMKRCHGPVLELLSANGHEPKTSEFYFASLSSDTIVYAPLLTPTLSLSLSLTLSLSLSLNDLYISPPLPVRDLSTIWLSLSSRATFGLS